MFEKPGSGGAGVGVNNAFGNQFGAYADLVVQRVTEKWQTTGLAGMHLPMAVITFDILRDGSVQNAKIAQSQREQHAGLFGASRRYGRRAVSAASF